MASSNNLTSPPSIQNHITIKLTPFNYLLWKTQLIPFLCDQQLFHHINGSSKPPPTEVNNAPNPEYTTWYLKDQTLLGWILSSLLESVLSHVVGVTSTYDAWSRLQTAYASGSRVQIRTLKNSLHCLARDNDSIITYMDRAKRLYNQLAVLNSDYRPFVRNLEARLTSITFDDLFGLLLSEELQLKYSDLSLNLSAVAHHATRHTNLVRSRGRGHHFRRGGFPSSSGHGRSSPSSSP